MQVQVNTDNNVTGSEGLQQHVEQVVENSLGRFSEQITRVEVHLNDVNADKGGGRDNRCMVEARLAGMAPLAATHQAATLDQALGGAADKLQRMLDSALGKLRDHR